MPDDTSQTTRYRIAWRSKITGDQGATTASMSLADAHKWCRELNGDWSNFEHWPEPVSERTDD